MPPTRRQRRSSEGSVRSRCGLHRVVTRSHRYAGHEPVSPASFCRWRSLPGTAADVDHVPATGVLPRVPPGLSMRVCCRRRRPLSSRMRGSADLRGDYDAGIASRRLAGVAAQAMPVLDEHGKLLHAETVAEIADEPDGDAAPAVPAPSERSLRRAGAGRRVDCGWADEIARDAIADGVS